MFERERRPRDSRDEHRGEGRSFTDRVRDLARAEFDWMFAKDGAITERLLAGSVPGNAVALDPPVADVPVSGFPGQFMRFRHTDGEAPWLCVWDPALNSGAGAWAVTGGAPLVDEQGSSGNHSGAEGPMPNTPALTVPASGVYRVSAFGRATIAGSAATSDATVRLGVNSVGSSVLGIETAGTQFHGSTVGGSTGDLTLAKGDALTLRVAGSGSVVWAFGLTLPWRMFLHPIEVRA